MQKHVGGIVTMSRTQKDDRDFAIANKRRRKKKSFASKIFASFMLTAAVSAAIIAVVSLLFLKEITESLPSTPEILAHEPSLATKVYDRKGRLITQLFQENRTWAKLQDVWPWLVKGILAAEDSKFYEHSGIRPVSIVRALLVDIFHGETKQGASTITQQLARNLFLSNEKTIIRKAREVVLAIRLERIYTKDQLLDMYLNTIYMGHGAYGIEAASRAYFAKPPSRLDINTTAVLAGLVAAPEKYSPFRHQGNSQARKSYVLRRMLYLGWISKADNDENIEKPLSLTEDSPRGNPLTLEDAPYFVSHILFSHLLPSYGADRIYRGGLSVYTTIDKDLQAKGEELVSAMKHEGALVALDPDTGEILALVGGRDFNKSKFNRATQAFRQPGSSFKPIVYASALEEGYRGVDHVLDAPLLFPNGWAPGNYSEDKYDGEVTLMKALARSINTSAVRLAQISGVGRVTDLARRIGITTPHLPDDLSVALGTASLTPLEMCAAYSVFANNGYQVKTYAIKEIRSQRGETLEQNGPQLAPAIAPGVAVTMRSMLQQVTAWGTGANAKISGHETFGKTGTTNEWTDAWFVGGVPGLVVVVYVGNDDYKPLGKRSTGAAAALPVWKAFVEYAAKTMALPASFAIPSDAEVEAVRVCRATGFLAAPGCEAADLLLPQGHAPSSLCPWHGGAAAEALADANAPVLLLAPIDEETDVNLYAMHLGGAPTTAPQSDSSAADAPPQQQGTPAADVPPQPQAASPVTPTQKTKEREPAKVPSAAEEKQPYKKRTYETQDEVEKRYQELLKQYGLI